MRKHVHAYDVVKRAYTYYISCTAHTKVLALTLHFSIPGAYIIEEGIVDKTFT